MPLLITDGLEILVAIILNLNANFVDSNRYTHGEDC